MHPVIFWACVLLWLQGLLPQGQNKRTGTVSEQSVTAGPLPGPPQWGMQLSLSQARCNGLFPTPAPMFIYPQALDGQTRWEPDNSNRNNGKGEQDLSLGSPPCLCSLIQTLTHVCTQTVTEHSAYSRALCTSFSLDISYSKLFFCCFDHRHDSLYMKLNYLVYGSVCLVWSIVTVFCMGKHRLHFLKICENLIVVLMYQPVLREQHNSK